MGQNSLGSGNGARGLGRLRYLFLKNKNYQSTIGVVAFVVDFFSVDVDLQDKKLYKFYLSVTINRARLIMKIQKLKNSF